MAEYMDPAMDAMEDAAGTAEEEAAEFLKKSRGQQFFFVNKRFIKSSFLNHSICKAFEGLIREKYHPGYFLQIQISNQLS